MFYVLNVTDVVLTNDFYNKLKALGFTLRYTHHRLPHANDRDVLFLVFNENKEYLTYYNYCDADEPFNPDEDDCYGRDFYGVSDWVMSEYGEEVKEFDWLNADVNRIELGQLM